MTKSNEKFDPTKPVRTEDGCKARILCTNLRNIKSPEGDGILAIITDPETGHDVVATYTSEGRYLHGCWNEIDLVNVPVKRVRWMNIYPGKKVNVHESKKMADSAAMNGRIACIRVEFEEGEGLE